MWMARQFHMSGLIAVGAISLGIIGALFDLLILMIDFELLQHRVPHLALVVPDKGDPRINRLEERLVSVSANSLSRPCPVAWAKNLLPSAS